MKKIISLIMSVMCAIAPLQGYATDPSCSLLLLGEEEVIPLPRDIYSEEYEARSAAWRWGQLHDKFYEANPGIRFISFAPITLGRSLHDPNILVVHVKSITKRRSYSEDEILRSGRPFMSQHWLAPWESLLTIDLRTMKLIDQFPVVTAESSVTFSASPMNEAVSRVAVLRTQKIKTREYETVPGTPISGDDMFAAVVLFLLIPPIGIFHALASATASSSSTVCHTRRTEVTETTASLSIDRDGVIHRCE